MIKAGFLFLLLATTCSLSAQMRISGAQAVPAIDQEGNIRMLGGTDIEGSRYATEDWKEGSILFSNGISIKGGLLNFDLYRNKPIFRDGEAVFHFKDPVREIRYEAEFNGKLRTLIFRNEYPPIGNQNRSFYYRVERDGAAFHLLQLVAKIVHEEVVNIASYEKKYVQKEDWYLYDVSANKLLKLPKNRKDLLADAAGLSPALTAYIKSKNPNPKDPQSLVAMVEALNGE